MGRKWGGEEERRLMQKDVTAVLYFSRAMMSLAAKRTPLHIFLP